MNTEFEEMIMSLILNAGNARSLAIEALRLARKGLYTESGEKMKECEEAMNEAHHVQTEMIQAEIRGEETKMTLLAVHAQDHVMNAMTVHDLVREIIENMKESKNA